jgi:hypothetical protein
MPPQVPSPVVAPRSRPVNSLAVVALVCSLIPGFPAAGGIVAGVVARKQIRESGDRGAGVATAAILIGTLAMVLFLVYLVSLVGFR